MRGNSELLISSRAVSARHDGLRHLLTVSSGQWVSATRESAEAV
jgi:hypothetical protein